MCPRAEQAEPERSFFRDGRREAGGVRGWNHLGEGVQEDPAIGMLVFGRSECC